MSYEFSFTDSLLCSNFLTTVRSEKHTKRRRILHQHRFPNFLKEKKRKPKKIENCSESLKPNLLFLAQIVSPSFLNIH